MNSFTTDWLAICAYTTIGIDGGMIGPSSAPAAITAPAKPSPYPFSRIAGISGLPVATASATADPDTPDRTKFVMIETWPRLPLKLADERLRPVDQPRGEPAAVHQLAGKDEERDLDERVAVDVRDHRQRHHHRVDRTVGLRLDPEPGGEHHREADVEPDDDQQQEREEEQDQHLGVEPLRGRRRAAPDHAARQAHHEK